MDIKIIASGSSGNAYLLQSGENMLLLDCGVPIKQIQAATGFRVARLDGCLLGHDHGDHSKAAADLIRLSCPVYSSRGTLEKLKLSSHKARVLEHNKQYRIGGWIVQPFNVVHDAAEPFGFLVSSMHTGENLLYATDTLYMDTVFNCIDYFIIEANHDEQIITENVDSGLIDESLKRRIRRNHLSLHTLIDYLKACNLSKAKQIYLCHLSENNSDAARFKEEIQKIAGVEVYIC